jgi:hypothetical protein
MLQSLPHRRVAQAYPQRLLQARIAETPRFAHEGKQFRRQAPGRLCPRDARRPLQSRPVGDQVEPIPHLHLGVVGRIVGSCGRILLERARADRREVVGVDVIAVDIVRVAQRRRAGAQALERQAVGGVDAGRAQHHERDAVGLAP